MSVGRVVAPGVLMIVLLASCGEGAATRAAAPPGTPEPTAKQMLASPRPTTPATRDCTVSWAKGYTSLDLLAYDAELVVRATALRQETVALRPGFGPRPTREARRTVFRITGSVKANGEPPSEIAVLEDVCPNLTVTSGEEWILFARAADAVTEPATTGNYYTLGGPQGQFRLAAGRVSGPFFKFAQAVHSYEGAAADEVVADVRGLAPLDPEVGVRFVEARGWKVARRGPLFDLILPRTGVDDFGLFSMSDVIRASTDAGLDPTPYLGQALVIVPVDLVDTSGRNVELHAQVAISRGRVVAAWGLAWRSDAACGVFSLRSPLELERVACK